MTLILSSVLRSIKTNFSNKLINVHTIRTLHTTNIVNALFYEKDPKDGYGNKAGNKEISKTQQIRDGLKQLRHEIELWKSEVAEKFDMDPIAINRPGETDIVWNFKTEQKLKQWVLTSDSDHNEGHSSCSLTMNNSGKAVFSGELRTKVPKDGKVQRAGYCNMRSVRIRKSFMRESYHDWTSYNLLVLRVRGDGRSYMLNLSTTGYFDVLWNDVYHYVLFTRGGPYWQTAKIPFSKFFLSSKGRIQDVQAPIALHRVTNFGISAGDKINGPFNLEIDYIGLEDDPNLTEEFAYEMYKTDKYLVAN